jgi:serine/threonine protein kinase
VRGDLDRCVDEETALAFIAGELSAIEVQRVEVHADECSVCRSFLSALAAAVSKSPSDEAPISPDAATEMGETPGPIASVPLFTRGDTIGRYVVLSQVGVGGMGVVYAAYDPELDRKVAVKLLRKLRLSQEVARARLIREAQALARLTHPNVVTVYDAGAYEDQVFLAMEFVEGGTVAAWQHQPRPWREVLDTYLLAGRGLSAAHARGLVHRDFKPDNVLIGRDGRVLVTDFGLARSLGQDDGSEEPRPPSPPSPPTLTATGAVLGTPGYMAPEQNRGLPADARSDQYSFCISLYEGLHGRRPEQPPLAERREVPAWLEQIVARGMAADPAARYPSMSALLDALARDPAAARRRLGVIAGIALMVAALAATSGLFVMRSLALGRACTGGAQRFDKTLSAERRARLQGLADRAGSGDGPLPREAASRWARLLGLIDGYRRDWIGGYTDACEATRLRHDQSEELLNLRMSCLDAQLPTVDVLASLLEKNEPDLLTRLLSREVLGQVAPCADRAALQAKVPPPKDPATRAKVEALRPRLQRARALMDAGEYKTSGEQIGPVVEEARALGYAPLHAEALDVRATLEEHAGDLAGAERDYTDAALTGEATRYDELAARARTSLVFLVGAKADRPAEGRKLVREAEAAVARLGGSNPRIERTLLDKRASVASEDKKPDEARALYLQEIALLEKAAPDSMEMGRAENNLGVLEGDNSRHEEAAKHLARALKIEQAILGPHHPLVLQVLYNRLINLQVPPIDEARDLVQRATIAWGPDNLELAPFLEILGEALIMDPKHRAEAPEPAARALAIYQKSLAPEHEEVALAHSHLGETLTFAGRFREADVELQQFVKFAEAHPGAKDLVLRDALQLHARALLKLNRAAEARRELERAYAIPPDPDDPHSNGLVELELAEALAATHDVARAKKLAHDAVTNLEKHAVPDDEELAEARAFIAAHP